MAQPMLQAKLNELAERMAGMQRRIRDSGDEGLTAVLNESAAVRRDYAACAAALEDRLHNSHSALVRRLSDAYEDMGTVLKKTRDELMEEQPLDAERRMLLAEYELDFAMLAVDRALMTALDAIAAQLTLTEEERT